MNINVNSNLQISQSVSGAADVRSSAAQEALAKAATSSASVTPSTSSVEKVSMEEIQVAASDLSDYLSSVSRALSISVDSDLNRPIVTVLDSETEEVVRQIPAEELVQIAKFLRSQGVESAATKEALSGILLKEEG